MLGAIEFERKFKKSSTILPFLIAIDLHRVQEAVVSKIFCARFVNDGNRIVAGVRANALSVLTALISDCLIKAQVDYSLCTGGMGCH